MKRRDFLKYIGVGGAGLGLGALFRKFTKPPGAKLIPYLVPPEDVVPGVATWYSSLCTQCPAGCGLHVRVMEGRVKKVEGNPLHPINKGKLCARGQAGPQALYNPDRIKSPLKRTGERGAAQFTEISWDEAISTLSKNLSGLNERGESAGLYFLTSTLRGARRRLVNEFMSSLGAANHIQYDLYQNRNLRWANETSMGLSTLPHYDIANTGFLLSFGADFSTTWLSPVSLSRGYGEMRQGGKERGRLVQVEPRLSLTGAVADEWVPAKPGTEGVLALSMAYHIIEAGLARGSDAGSWRGTLSRFRPSEATKITDVPAEKIEMLAREFASVRPALAIAGECASSYENGASNVIAVNILNQVTGNIGVKGGVIPNPEGVSDSGRGVDYGKGVSSAVSAASNGKAKALLVYNTNPAFTTPKAMKTAEALRNIPFIASFSSFMDETTALADLILPSHTSFEDWGDDFAEPLPGVQAATLMQPSVSPVFNTMGFGDILLKAGKAVGGRTATAMGAETFAGYLQDSWRALYSRRADMQRAHLTFDEFWHKALERGGWWPGEGLSARGARLSFGASSGNIPSGQARFEGEEGAYPFYLLLYPHTTHTDGRGANLPWLQELPDPMTSVVWGNWVEINPATARRLGISEGDLIEIESPFGKVSAPAYLYNGIRPDTVAMPFGQGHSQYGRYAAGRGDNPMEVLPVREDKRTGSIAMNSTRVKVKRLSGQGGLSKTEGTARELGRDIVKTISHKEYASLKKGGPSGEGHI